MSLTKWIACCALGAGLIVSSPAIARGQGKGKGHNNGAEPICLVSFNYDLLLDRALESFDYQPQRPADQFRSHTVLKLFKPHSSVNWARSYSSLLASTVY
jgi:hypothetical protein